MKSRKSTLGYPILLCSWAAVIAASLVSLWRYETAAGKMQDMIPQWPNDSGITRNESASTFLMFVHPRCPCSEASIVELEDVLRKTNASATVVVWLPEDASNDWMNTALVSRAAKIDGVTIHFDDAGKEANRFGILTSGHCLVFDKSGAIVFSGGITGSRGHIGKNPGSAMVTQQLELEHVSVQQTYPVYGCPLRKQE